MRPVLLLAVPVAGLMAFFVVPLLRIFVASFYGTDVYNDIIPQFTLAQYGKVLGSADLVPTLWRTTVMALEVTALSLLLAYPAAHGLVAAKSRTMRALLYAVVVSPLLTSVVVRTYGWIVLLAANGPINEFLVAAHLVPQPVKLLFNYPAVVIAVTHVLLPFAVLPLIATLSKLDPDLARASIVLGASRFQTFLRVTLPMTVPGVVSGALLVFLGAMGIYITPLLVGGAEQPLTPIRVYVQALQLFNVPLSSALSFSLLAIAFVISLASMLTFRAWERRMFG